MGAHTKLHSNDHVNGNDDIQEASASQKGLMSITYASKLDGIEAGADVTDTQNVNAAGAVMNTDTSTAPMQFVVDEDNMASDLDTKVPTQQSVKAYVLAHTIFGSEYDQAEELTESTTTSTSYVTKLDYTTASVPPGKYRIGWYYESRMNTAAKDFKFRLQVGVTTYVETNTEHKDASNYVAKSGFFNIDLASSGTVNIKLAYATESSSYTARMRNVRIEFWRVS